MASIFQYNRNLSQAKSFDLLQGGAVPQAPRQTSVTNLFKKEKSLDQNSFAPSLKKNQHSNDIMLNFSRLPSCFRDLAPKIADINQRVSE